jgi:uncharacterized protein (DUF736 family)
MPWLEAWEKVIGNMKLRMPNDLVVVRNLDADEAGDYRVMKHCDAVANPLVEITDIDPKDLD